REGNRGVELSGKTIGIIGYGNTGSAVAKKLRGFNMKILAYDKYLKNFGNEYVHECTLQEIFDATDIVTLHVPLTTETRQMVNEVFINSFNKPIYLLNLSRGEVIDTMHLIQAMQSNKVLGVALDVLENEKPASFNENEKTWMKYLTQSNKTVLTPHIAGWTKESYFKISEVLLRKVLALS
ncbi:MAG: phosphoglycerate dehydrogenase, partial [Bacteroidia bacterium]|nr:phosphoglycerate dehydrogenase [Bacteroidia bacterium]